MRHNILVNNGLAMKIRMFTQSEKKLLTKTIDLMESQGQLGEPLFREINVWKYRIQNLRIIYRKTSTSLIILSVEKSILPSFRKYE